MGHNRFMSTVFEMIIREEIPGLFVWSDDSCVAIMTIEPISPGHVLVIPRDPISKWTDLPEALLDHVMNVAQVIGQAQEAAFDVPRVAVIIAGFEVPHTHVHVVPAVTEASASLQFAREAPAEQLEEAAKKLRGALVAAGHGDHVPPKVTSPNLG